MDDLKKCLSPECDRLTYTAYCCRGCLDTAKGATVIGIVGPHSAYCEREIAPRTKEKK